ncbi:BnaC06g05190D [Brassica napus]|uniref:BnaC06g05190D protein n=1 Tax=Brassica napus TaxID=3708 RepID=A0A078IEN9_BRANA|nr:BnaC06g05190D [Brassica napus]
MTQRLEAEGSKNGRYIWDDGFNHDDVTKIYVRGGSDGIQFIRFDYIMKGQLNNGSFHGQSYKGFTQTFEINHLKHEHLESVNGYYTKSTGVQALQFKTNLRISELMEYDDKGTKFTLAVHEKKITGFQGSKQSNIYSLGAYFTWITPTRMEAKGGNGGKEWDDGSDHEEGVTKIHVRGGRKGIQYIKFEYVKDGQLKDGPVHGSISGGGFEPVVYVQGFEERCDSLRRRRLHLSWNRGHRDELGWKRVARGVTGIRVARGVTGITFGRWWMAIRRETTQNVREKMEIIMFEIRHVDQECLVSVEGNYDVQFKTNSNTSKRMGYNKGRISQKFGNEQRFGDLGILFESKGCALVGFHG